MKSVKTANWIISFVTLLLSGLVLSTADPQRVKYPVQVEQQIPSETISDNSFAHIDVHVQTAIGNYKTLLFAANLNDSAKFNDLFRFTVGTRLGSVANLIDRSLQIKRQIQFCNNTQLTFSPLILKRGFVNTQLSPENGEAATYS